MKIGDRIEKKRKEKGISQVDLAEKIHVSKQTLYKYENNIVTNIPSDKIELLAESLDTTPAYLMGWENNSIQKVSNISERLHTIMQERNLSQTDILHICSDYSEKYGIKITNSELTKYLHQEVTPPATILLILGAALNVNESWLIGLDVLPIRDKLSTYYALNYINVEFEEQLLNRISGTIEASGYRIVPLGDGLYRMTNEEYWWDVVVSKKELMDIDNSILYYATYTYNKYFTDKHFNTPNNTENDDLLKNILVQHGALFLSILRDTFTPQTVNIYCNDNDTIKIVNELLSGKSLKNLSETEATKLIQHFIIPVEHIFSTKTDEDCFIDDLGRQCIYITGKMPKEVYTKMRASND